MSQDHSNHGHAHSHAEIENLSDGRLFAAVGVNGLLTIVQIIGGVVSGSLSLIADALHNLNDAASLALALAARRIARMPADHRRTFGYRRAETIGALINLTTLILVGFYLIYEAVMRYFEPKEIHGGLVIIVAAVALVVDVATALLTYAMSKNSLNIKAAFIHNVADALGSVAVIVVGVLIMLYDLTIADVIATLTIAAYVLYQGITMMRGAIRTLMESVPEDIHLDEVINELSKMAHVKDVHHVHVWELDEHHRALEAHVVVNEQNLSFIEEIKQSMKEKMRSKFDIHHSTLEIELFNEETTGCSQINESQSSEREKCFVS
ncbi:MAG: cation diffusion facilitator family transporter [bacterium]|nr:cation diffusion facilitator family transporter [bacterium]